MVFFNQHRTLTDTTTARQTNRYGSDKTEERGFKIDSNKKIDL